MENNFWTITNDRLVEWYKLDNLPENINFALNLKQNRFIAGSNIKIDNSVPDAPVISSICWANIDYDVLSNRPQINWALLEWNKILSKEDVWLNNVDNTKDLEKPISNATAQAIEDLKSLSIQNTPNNIPVTTSSSYMQDATTYMRNKNAIPKDRDILYMKFSDYANSIFQVLYMDNWTTGSWNLIRNTGVFDSTGTIKNILYVTALPSQKNADTLYLVKE